MYFVYFQIENYFKDFISKYSIVYIFGSIFDLYLNEQNMIKIKYSEILIGAVVMSERLLINTDLLYYVYIFCIKFRNNLLAHYLRNYLEDKVYSYAHFESKFLYIVLGSYLSFTNLAYKILRFATYIFTTSSIILYTI